MTTLSSSNLINPRMRDYQWQSVIKFWQDLPVEKFPTGDNVSLLLCVWNDDIDSELSHMLGPLYIVLRSTCERPTRTTVLCVNYPRVHISKCSFLLPKLKASWASRRSHKFWKNQSWLIEIRLQVRYKTSNLRLLQLVWKLNCSSLLTVIGEDARFSLEKSNTVGIWYGMPKRTSFTINNLVLHKEKGDKLQIRWSGRF